MNHSLLVVEAKDAVVIKENLGVMVKMTKMKKKEE